MLMHSYLDYIDDCCRISICLHSSEIPLWSWITRVPVQCGTNNTYSTWFFLKLLSPPYEWPRYIYTVKHFWLADWACLSMQYNNINCIACMKSIRNSNTQQLRQELNRRKDAGESNLIIKYGKSVQKQPSNKTTPMDTTNSSSWLNHSCTHDSIKFLSLNTQSIISKKKQFWELWSWKPWCDLFMWNLAK